MENNQRLQNLQVKHLVYPGIFLLALGLRLFAAGRLVITQPEADILFRLTRDGAVSTSRGSLLYQLLTLPLMDLFGNGRLVVRLWLILAGAALTLVPLLFEDWLGEKQALILSALFALDPFGNAASLQLNSSLLTLCTLLVSLGLFHRRKYFFGSFSLPGFHTFRKGNFLSAWLGTDLCIGFISTKGTGSGKKVFPGNPAIHQGKYPYNTDCVGRIGIGFIPLANTVIRQPE